MEGVFHGAPTSARGLAIAKPGSHSIEHEWTKAVSWIDRDDGVIPNIWDWLPGDVLLYVHTNWLIRDLRRTAINLYQEITEQLTVDACKVIHVAIYDGYGYFWDLTIGDNVSRREVQSVLYDSKERFILRRLSVASDPQRLLQALEDSRELKYAEEKLTTARMFWNRFNDRPPPDSDLSRCAVCSNFVAERLYEATGRDPLAGRGTLPGDFYDSSKFATVPVNWLAYRNSASKTVEVKR